MYAGFIPQTCPAGSALRQILMTSPSTATTSSHPDSSAPKSITPCLAASSDAQLPMFGSVRKQAWLPLGAFSRGSLTLFPGSVMLMAHVPRQEKRNEKPNQRRPLRLGRHFARFLPRRFLRLPGDVPRNGSHLGFGPARRALLPELVRRLPRRRLA